MHINGFNDTKYVDPDTPFDLPEWFEQLRPKFRQLLSDEFCIVLFLLEERSKNKCHFTCKEILEYLSQSRENLNRWKLKRSILKLKSLDYVEALKTCPYCQHEYPNHIPPKCDSCHRLIFPHLLSISKESKWPVYIIRLRRGNLDLIVRDFEVMAKELNKIYVHFNIKE